MEGVLKYMNKLKMVISKIVILVLIFCIIVVFIAYKNNISYITDIDKYRGLTQDVDKIEVSYDINENYSLDFTIDDPSELNEIMYLILNTKLNKIDGYMDGSNTILYIYQGSKIYRINSRRVGYNNKTYLFETTLLYEKITNIKNSRFPV